MALSFNLVDQPFIPCILPDGRRKEFSLGEVLTQAHGIREIRDDSPLVTVSLHRLLLAILHRNFGPSTLAEWAKMLNEGKWDTENVAAYLTKWHSRFDLFDGKHPFYQTAGMATDHPLPVSALFDERALGNNATLFDHSADADPSPAAPSEAARGLIARQSFDIGFGKSPNCTIIGKKVVTGYRSDSPLTRGMSLLVLGRDLFETLMLNLTRYPDDPAKDLPAWERDDLEAVSSQDFPSGRTDLYTWQSRRLLLVAAEVSATTIVSGVHFAQGRALRKDVLDPMKPYRKTEDQQWEGCLLVPGKALWRDSAAILHASRLPDCPPSVLNWTARAAGRGLIARECQLNLAAFGICTDEGKAASLLLWRHDTMPLPLALLGDEKVLDSLRDAIVATEAAASSLGSAVWALVRNQRGFGNGRLNENQRKELRAAVESLGSDTKYWARMEGPFRRFLQELPGDDAHRSARLTAWKNEVRAIARSVFAQIVNGLDSSPRTLQAIYTDDWGGQKVLNVELAKIMSTANQE